MQNTHKQQIHSLSDKDIQLLRKTYCRLTQLYYQNGQNDGVVRDLLHLSDLITQVIATPREVNALALLPIIEPLKIKAKSRPELLSHIDSTIKHLKMPSHQSIKYDNLQYGLQHNDLFTITCTIAIRFYEKIQVQCTDINWKQIIEQLARNVSISPALCIQLTYLICKQNQLYSRAAVKSGLIKYVFLSYISSTLLNRYNLYKAIRLLKVIATAEGAIVREKEKGLALVLYTYDDYVPVIEGIISKCYDAQYCQAIDRRGKYDASTLDQPYLWSYLQIFCQNNLNQHTVRQLMNWLGKPLNEVEEKKIYGILSNYSKFKKLVLKPALQILPKSQMALLNYIKLCVNCCEVDHSSSTVIDMAQLEALVDKSTNAKVDNLFKYLRQLKNKEHKIGVLSDNYKKMFDMQKNADFMMERAAKVPQNNQQLTDIQQIVKEKDRINQFESDTLKMVKEKALDSLHIAVMQKKKLDLNSILKNVDLNDVCFLARLLEILELCLTINEDLIDSVDVKTVLEIIFWIENNHKGQLIDWGSISQLLAILTDQNEWKNHLNELPQKAFWLLRIQSVEEEQTLWQAFSKIDAENYPQKISLLVGFISRALSADGRLRLSNSFPLWFSIMTENLKSSGGEYKKTLVMWSYFIKNWQSGSSQQHQTFQGIIKIVLNIVLTNFRGLEQEYELLESCLPYQIDCSSLADNLDYLINLYGRLASYVYREWKGGKTQINYQKIKALSRLSAEKNRNILEVLNFLQLNSELIQHDELSFLLANLINNQYVYWFLYPNFYNILSRIISILTNTNNSVLLNNLTNLLFQIITLLNTNSDAPEQEKIDLYNELKLCLIRISKEGLLIDKDRLKIAAEQITIIDIRDEIIQILDNYKPKQNTPELSLPVTESELVSDSNYRSTSMLKSPSSEASRQSIYDTSKENSISPEQMILQLLQFSEGQKNDGDMTPLQAMRILKKIIEQKQPESKFPTLYDIFMKNTLVQEYIDVLGHLLAAFYPQRPKQMQQMCIDLFINNQKTRLSRQTCYKLLKNNPETFVLSRRWKLKGQDWLDLAMLRISQGYITDGSQVAEHNVCRNSQLEYFLKTGYHELVINAFNKCVGEDELVNMLVLIGTSGRHQQIKNSYYKQNLHVKGLKLVGNFIGNTKFFANLLYALSSLVYKQQEACFDLIKYPKEMKILLNEMKNQVDNRNIIESGSCLIANLSYSGEQVKEALRQVGTIPTMMYIFEALLPTGEADTFKHILRSFGNLSLSVNCSKQLIDHHFCALAVRMTQSIDMLVNFQQKAPVVKIMLELVVNLSSHKYKLDVFHSEGITPLLLIIIENIDTQIPILTACIDTIDCLCQNPQIENYMVCERKIPFVLIDVLKIQTDQKIVVKTTRLLTNLTINKECIPHLLKANLLSVMANIVMPHFYGNRMAVEQHKKMQTYILKIISRIYHSKPDKETILKSGYLDCLVRTVQTSDVIEDTFIDLLYFYADIMPSFLNKRAFLCLIRALGKKLGSKDVMTKCLRAIKKLSVLYERNEEDLFIPGTAQTYEKLLSSDLKAEGLQLLAYHLLRSGLLRQDLVQQQNNKVLDLVKKLSENSSFMQICKQINFLVYNPFVKWEQTEPTDHQKQFQTLNEGIRCKLYRIDGSFKKAIVDMTVDYQLRAYKYPDGQIKNKYVIDIRQMKDCQFNYPLFESFWNSTVFPHEKGIFDSSKCQPKHCCTLISSKKWGAISFVNLEFDSLAEKERFQFCVRTIYNSLR